jgi:hypothetical protein
VALADGHAFVVENGPYMEHLSDSTDIKQACPLRLLVFSDSTLTLD